MTDKKQTTTILLMTSLLIIATLNTVNADINKTNCPSGMVSYWTFDNSSNLGKDDFNGNNGAVNGAVWNSSGQVNGSIQFDGINDYIIVPNAANINFATNITILAWIKSDDNREAPSIINKYPRSTYPYNGWEVYLYSGKAVIGGRSGSGSYEGTGSNTSVNDSKWHFITAEQSGRYWMIYVDGILEKTYDTGYLNADLTNDKYLIMGMWQKDPGSPTLEYFYRGLVDEVAIFNRTLNSSEILQIYTAGNNSHQGYCTPLQQEQEKVPEITERTTLTIITLIALFIIVLTAVVKKR